MEYSPAYLASYSFQVVGRLFKHGILALVCDRIIYRLLNSVTSLKLLPEQSTSPSLTRFRNVKQAALHSDCLTKISSPS